MNPLLLVLLAGGGYVAYKAQKHPPIRLQVQLLSPTRPLE